MISRLAYTLRHKKDDMGRLEYSVYVPMEFKVENAWDIPEKEWAKKVYDADIAAINSCDEVWALYRGWKTNTGTAFEIGYARGLGKPITLVIPEDIDKVSLMVFNSTNEERKISYEEYINNKPILVNTLGYFKIRCAKQK
jgi:nucleoside 2-deoxyribosyltransferase